MQSWHRSLIWLVFCFMPIPLLAATAAASDPEFDFGEDRIAPPLTTTVDWSRVRLPDHPEPEGEAKTPGQMPEPFLVDPLPEPVTPWATPLPAPETGLGSAVSPPMPVPNAVRPGREPFYVVQPGDNLFRIGRAYGLTAAELAAANEISNEKLIHPGQVLVIPGAAGSRGAVAVVATPRPTVASDGTYLVQAGDTLERIARRLGIPAAALLDANLLDNPRRLRVGQRLKLPHPPTARPAATPAAAPTSTPPPPVVTDRYVVQRGDSLYHIGRRFGVTVQQLAAANNISNPALIHAGLELVIPPGSAATLVAAAVTDTSPAPVTIEAEPDETPEPPPAATPTPPPPVTPTPPAEVPPAEPADTLFIWPVESRHITQRFRAGHRAIDIITPIGSPVIAAAAGTVEFSGWNVYGYGNLVVIDHGNGWRTLYAHNDSLLVEAGQAVAQGELISLSGSTGRSNWPHVHLEIYQNGRLVDPCGHLPGGC
jgi:murein DD-endopeptidase MepM/ murein hydrolase activator NlpD